MRVGAAIAMFMQGTERERPLTHDLLANIDRVIVNDLKHDTYFARLVLRPARGRNRRRSEFVVDFLANRTRATGALTLASALAASSSARREARTDLDLASQKIHKSSGPLQMPAAHLPVGSGRDPEYPDC